MLLSWFFFGVACCRDVKAMRLLAESGCEFSSFVVFVWVASPPAGTHETASCQVLLGTVSTSRLAVSNALANVRASRTKLARTGSCAAST